MSRSDREDAAAKALDILPPGDEARSDPRLLRDPELIEEARLTREAAADLWLAVSPLRAAPPDVLPAVMAKIDAKPAAAGKTRRPVLWLAASGWSAAAAVALALWPRTQEHPAGPPPVIAEDGVKEAEATAQVPPLSPRQAAEATRPDPEERRLRGELMKLRGSLARLSDDGALTAPRVISLSSPGGVERSPEEARERVWAVLTGALRSALEAESGAPNDPAALVIERGWLPEGVVVPEDGSLIRHRNFPEAYWQELGLLKSDEGSYYDPAKHLVWAKDEEGRGFIGRRAGDTDNLDAFKAAGTASPALAANEFRTQPEGFVIEDPVTNKAEVVIDQVPPPAEGMEQLVVWEDANGVENTVKLGSVQSVHPGGETAGVQQSAYPGANNPLVFSSSFAGGLQGLLSNTIVFTIPNSGGVKSFKLVESPILPNGRPRRVIVQGGK